MTTVPSKMPSMPWRDASPVAVPAYCEALPQFLVPDAMAQAELWVTIARSAEVSNSKLSRQTLRVISVMVAAFSW